MSGLVQAAGALGGVALGVAAALAVARPVARVHGWAFWTAVVLVFVAGVAATTWAAAAGLQWLAGGTIAFPLGFATALKWATGRVPGVRPDRDSRRQSP